MDECTSCGEAAVETEDHNGEVQRVCTTCGVVQERSVTFSTDQEESTYFHNNGKDLFANQSAPLSIQRESRPKNCKGRKQIYQKITVLASHFHLTPGMKTEVFNLYDRAMLDKTVLMWQLKRKAVLAGCCMYAIMRQHNWPINVNQICNEMDCYRVDFSKTYFKLLKLLNLSIVSAPIEQLVEKFISECKNLESAEKDLLTSRVRRILKLAKDFWMTEGRSQRSILVIVIYIAWQSLDLKRGQKSLDDFCKSMGFGKQASMISRNLELRKLLCEMANKIPWYEPDTVKPSNLYKYLEEVLKYSESLLHDSSSECSGINRQSKTREATEEPTQISSIISDKEIESYIRSEEEVRLILEMKNGLDSDDSATVLK